MTLPRKLRAYALAMLACLVGATYPAYASEKEQLVKAAFLFNFIKFASWPSPIDIASQQEINICILGDNTLGRASEVIEKGSSSKLAINARQISSAPTAPGQCHVVFITNTARVESFISQSHAQMALTVSDADGFVQRGGIIGFVKERNKIRLHINKGAADRAGIQLDAQLLEIAGKVIR